MDNKTIAIIGFGRFGKLLSEILLNNTNSKIIIVDKNKINISNKRIITGSIEEIKNADLIMPSVPISEFEKVVKQISPFVKKGAVVMDVSSVKILPVSIMKKFLPKTTQIIATHPMFGPDSYKITGGLNNLKLVMWNISSQKEIYSQIKKFFSSLKLKIVELSPQDHDKLMSQSLGYSYLIGKICQRLNIKETPIDTYDFQLLLEHASIIKSDSEQLFFDMQTKNPFAKKMQLKVKNAFNNLLKEIGQLNKKEV